MKKLIRLFKDAWDTDRKLFWYLISSAVAVLLFIAAAIWRFVHNWNLTTPERLTDPLNWILGIGAAIIYLGFYWWGKKQY